MKNDIDGYEEYLEITLGGIVTVYLRDLFYAQRNRSMFLEIVELVSIGTRILVQSEAIDSLTYCLLIYSIY
jgi:hypothetical protein